MAIGRQMVSFSCPNNQYIKAFLTLERVGVSFPLCWSKVSSEKNLDKWKKKFETVSIHEWLNFFNNLTYIK